MTQFRFNRSGVWIVWCLLWLAAFAFAAVHANAQTVYPMAVCVEYVNYSGAQSAGAPAYIGHFAYFSTEAQDVTVPRGVSSSNFFSPGTATFTAQPTVFSPYYSDTVRLPMSPLQVSWTVMGNTATLTAAGSTDGTGNAIQASPTCRAVFIPATTLSYSQPGTYTHQYLGQVESGPPAATGTTLGVSALSEGPGVVLSNLTYVPYDTAELSNFLNPNSIYGDVTIGDVGAAKIGVRLQLTANGRAVIKGIDTIAYAGTLTLPDSTATVVSIGSAEILAGGSAVLSAQVTDATKLNEVPTGSVIFDDTFNGVTTLIGTVPSNNGQASLTYTPTAFGSHTLTAIYNPTDPTVYATSAGTLSKSVTVGQEHVWVLNADGTLTGLSDNGTVVVTGAGTVGTASPMGGVAVDGSGEVLSVTSQNLWLSRMESDGSAATTFNAVSMRTPSAVAVDGSGAIWVTNSTHSSVSVFSSTLTPISGDLGFSADSLHAPASVAIDASGSVWIANSGDNSVVEIVGAAAPVVTPVSSAVLKPGAKP